jgi:hypothetical protein
MPAAVTNPATAPPATLWRNFRLDASSFDTPGWGPQVEEDPESGGVCLRLGASFFASNVEVIYQSLHSE